MSSEDSAATNTIPRSRVARALAEGGILDVHVVSRETAAALLTETRQNLIGCLRNGDHSTVVEIADALDRDVTAVEQDLDFLFEADVIETTDENDSNVPALKHTAVIAEPLA